MRFWRSRCARTASRFRRGRPTTAGIVDAIVDGPRDALIAGAVAFAGARAAAGDLRRTRDRSDTIADLERGLAACDARRAELKRQKPSPVFAPWAAINAIEAAHMLAFDAGSVVERGLFADCVLSTESRALVHLFFAEREANKVPGVSKQTPTRAIARAAVVGAGTMGGGIAMTYANAGIPVLLKDVDQIVLDRARRDHPPQLRVVGLEGQDDAGGARPRDRAHHADDDVRRL